MLEAKFAKESLTIMTEMVLPNDTNTLNNLMGGRLLYMMDVVAAVAAQKHSNCLVVTASVDNVSFAEPIPLGSIVTLEAKVTRVFNTSMEVGPTTTPIKNDFQPTKLFTPLSLWQMIQSYLANHRKLFLKLKPKKSYLMGL
jgi:acyl-CoA hydrolase